MFDRPVTPVVPPTGVEPLTAGPFAGVSKRPPLAQLLTHPGSPDWTYAISRVDHSGRASARAVLGTLGWAAADRLAVIVGPLRP